MLRDSVWFLIRNARGARKYLFLRIFFSKEIIDCYNAKKEESRDKKSYLKSK